MKNVHVYGTFGAEVGILGWILEQSPSYKTKNFTCTEQQLLSTQSDPWDNHNADPDHWSHKWIEIQESQTSFDKLNDIIASGDQPGVWGISYGMWHKDKWETPAIKLGIKGTPRVFKFWWKNYMERIILNPKRAFDMHIHDHHQDDPVYKKHMYETYADYFKEDTIPFWKLQCAFHWGFDRCVTDADKDKALEIASDNSNPYPADIWVDIFSLDIKELCSKLECKYTEEMEKQYKIYLAYCENILKI